MCGMKFFPSAFINAYANKPKIQSFLKCKGFSSSWQLWHTIVTHLLYSCHYKSFRHSGVLLFVLKIVTPVFGAHCTCMWSKTFSYWSRSGRDFFSNNTRRDLRFSFLFVFSFIFCSVNCHCKGCKCWFL